MVIGPEEWSKVGIVSLAEAEPLCRPLDPGANEVWVYTPRRLYCGKKTTILSLCNSKIRMPFYPQHWYLNEDFASSGADGAWHLLPTHIEEGSGGKWPLEDYSRLPTAITCVLAFLGVFAYYG